MWKPKSISFTNLFSHEETVYFFKQNELDLLIGINSDKNGCSSNGSGKSALIEAITLAVTGEVYRDISRTHFIRNGEKQCIVIFNLMHSVTKQNFRIERVFFNNSKSATVRLFLIDNDVEREQTQLTNPNEANKFIFTILGISKSDFLNYYVIGQGNNDNFFSAGDTGQKAVIARFSNYTQIDLVIDKLKSDVGVLQDEVKPIQSQLDKVDAVIEHLKEEIENANSTFEEDKKQKINSKQEQVDKLKNSSEDIKTKLSANNLKLIEKQSKLVTLKVNKKDVSQLKLKLADLKTELADLKTEQREIERTLIDLNKQSGKVLNCPKCGEAFIPESELEPEEVADMIELTKQLESEGEINIDKKESQIQGCKDKIDLENENDSKIRVLNNEINSFEEIKMNYEEQLSSNEKRIKNLLIEIQEVTKQKPKSSISEFKSKLEVQKSEKSKLEIQIKDFENQIREKEFFQFHFSNKGFKTFLANKSLKSIQDTTNYYLEKIGSNLQLYISGYKQLKSGEIRDKIEVFVLTDGAFQTLFGAYSGGEKCRVIVCTTVAIQFLINNNSETGGLDLLVFDELNFLDAEGQKEVVDTFDKLNTTSVIVLHHMDSIPYKNKTYIQKQNKISKIVEIEEPKMTLQKLDRKLLKANK